MDNKRKKLFLNLLTLAAVALSCITFTPLVMPYGRHEPTLLNFPYTLWTGLIVALLLVLLTWLAVRIHPGREEDES
jgi:hypothetical protein